MNESHGSNGTATVFVRCRGCTAKLVIRNVRVGPSGTFAWGGEMQHGPRCPFIVKAKEEGVADMEWLDMTFDPLPWECDA